jgi:hypothetical protein
MGLAQSTAAGHEKDRTSLVFAVLEPDEARASFGNENTSPMTLLSWQSTRHSTTTERLKHAHLRMSHA